MERPLRTLRAEEVVEPEVAEEPWQATSCPSPVPEGCIGRLTVGVDDTHVS